ncbi:photosystem I assembly protein Ycf3 [Bacteroidales bacterium Barb4]|nr:photosystem I assembly protein Ycf3 [Bacteroidales bacterium Barb4]
MNKRLICILLPLLLCAGVFPLQANDKARKQRKSDYFFYEGLNLKAAGKYDAALEAFTHCLSIDSTSAAALYELSLFYMQLNKPDKVTELLKRAVANSSDNFTYRMMLASVNRSLGLFADAAEEYERLVRDYPAKTELNYYLAESLVEQGEFAKAIEAYNALESAAGMNEALSLQKYKLYLQAEDRGNAFQEIEKLAAKYPAEARYRLLLGDLHLENKETEKAYECYTQAHVIDPSNPYYFVSLSNYYEAKGDKDSAELQIKEALANKDLDVETKVGILSRYIVRLQQSKQETETANALFTALLEQHPEDTELKLMYGSLLMMQENMEEAKFQFRLVTEMEPDNPSAWQQLLSIALKTNDTEELVRLCTACMELFPDVPEYYYYLGIACYRQEKYQEALDTYYKGITVIPDDNRPLKSDFYGQIGDILHQSLHQPDKAYEAYEEALQYNDNNIMVLNNYSYFLSLDKKELKKAERMSARTVKVEPDNATYLDTYAWIFFVQGDYKLAGMYIEKALEKDTTNSPELIDHYGDILYMNGDPAKALEQWKRAKEMGKESGLLERKIAEEKYLEE